MFSNNMKVTLETFFIDLWTFLREYTMKDSQEILGTITSDKDRLQGEDTSSIAYLDAVPFMFPYLSMMFNFYVIFKYDP